MVTLKARLMYFRVMKEIWWYVCIGMIDVSWKYAFPQYVARLYSEKVENGIIMHEYALNDAYIPFTQHFKFLEIPVISIIAIRMLFNSISNDYTEHLSW